MLFLSDYSAKACVPSTSDLTSFDWAWPSALYVRNSKT